MMSPIVLVQGIGCVETGARAVLRELVQACPGATRTVVICTGETARTLVGRLVGRLPNGPYIIGLSHALFGRWLRLLLELTVALGALVRLWAVVNLSHYGLVLGGQYSLYMHSPLLLDRAAPGGWSRGRSNWVKRLLLRSALRRASPVVVQTQVMREAVQSFARSEDMQVPALAVLRPRIRATRVRRSRRVFTFQLFYPASPFPHKRPDLAVQSALVAHGSDSAVGLVITTGPPDDLKAGRDGVLRIGQQPPEAVWSWYAGSDALLFTSERETLGLPLLEALAAGLPVIAPRLPYAVEILGDAGCYFEEPDPAAVCAAIALCRGSIDEWRQRALGRARLLDQAACAWGDHWAVLLNGESHP